MVGFYAGPEVMIWDRFALSDPLGARFEPMKTDRRKGHEKFIEDAWFDARLAGNPLSSDNSSIAAEFLDCPRIDDLLTGITAPLTSKVLWDSIRSSLPDTFLRFPSEPEEALDVCDAIS